MNNMVSFLVNCTALDRGIMSLTYSFTQELSFGDVTFA